MKGKSGRKPLEFYLELSYPVTIYPAEDGEYLAEVQELPGCMTQGESVQEVLDLIEDARRTWIEVAYEDGQDIPLPHTLEEYSGRFVVRLTKSLHRRLAEAADKDGVSLNQYVLSLLSSRDLAQEVCAKLDAIARTTIAHERRSSVTVFVPSEIAPELSVPRLQRETSPQYAMAA